MIRKLILFTGLLFLVLINASAQKNKNEAKSEKLFYRDTTISTPELTIKIDDAVSTAAEIKFKIRITNKSNNYILYKPEESKFVIDGKENMANERWMLIGPNESESKVFNLKGSGYNSVKNYTFNMSGIYKVPAEAPAVNAPDFKLPVSQNDFTAGNFNVSLVKVAKKTEKTDVKFKCTYTGDKIGIIYPSKAAVKMPDSNEYANARTKAKPIIMANGKSEDFVLMWEKMQGGKNMDMQFANMTIKWRGTFVEVTPVKLKSENIDMKFDEEVTNAKKK